MTQTGNATQQPQIDMTDSVTGQETTPISVLSGKPKSAARLFGNKATSHTGLLSQTTDDDDFTLSYAVGGAIRHSYNCDEEVTRHFSDNMDQLQTGACSDCNF